MYLTNDNWRNWFIKLFFIFFFYNIHQSHFNIFFIMTHTHWHKLFTFSYIKWLFSTNKQTKKSFLFVIFSYFLLLLLLFILSFYIHYIMNNWLVKLWIGSLLFVIYIDLIWIVFVCFIVFHYFFVPFHTHHSLIHLNIINDKIMDKQLKIRNL